MNKNYIVGRLGYNSDNGRYGLLVMDLWEKEGFHCGECLEVQLPDTNDSTDNWYQTRMEMNAAGQWYLVGTPFCDNLEYIKARIKK